MTRHRPTIALARHAVCLVVLAALAGCGEPEQAQDGQATSTAPLPGPQQAGGAVTSMPDAPGPGEVPLAGSPPPAPAPAPQAADPGSGLPPLEDNPEAGLAAPAAPATGEPPASPPDRPAGDPRDVLRAYYAAINARDYGAALAAWDTGGAQAPTQLASEFANARSVELTVGEPRAPEGAAGSVYVEVPVTVTTTRSDGSVQRQAGRYTLRRAQVDGATPAQRGWHIAAVDLRDAAD